MAETNVWLERNKGQSHWAVKDCFAAPDARIRAFTHRNYRIGMHTHEFIELNVVAKGSGRHFMEGKAMEVSAGDAFIIPPMIEHGYIDDGGLDVCHVLLHPDYVAANFNRFRWLDGYLLFFTVEPYFRTHGPSSFRHGFKLEKEELVKTLSIYERLLSEMTVSLQGTEWARECLATLLIIELCRCYSKRAEADVSEACHPHMRAVAEAMRVVAGKRAVGASLDDMARAAGLERSHFCRVFRKATSMTPMEYVRGELAKEARRLLLEGELSVGEIAMRLGYCDAAHFTRSFRAATGRNPSELRKTATH